MHSAFMRNNSQLLQVTASPETANEARATKNVHCKYVAEFDLAATDAATMKRAKQCRLTIGGGQMHSHSYMFALQHVTRTATHIILLYV